MPKLKWISSYETLKFNTPDGDIHKGQYAVFNGQHLVRQHPENNNQFVCLEAQDNPDLNIPEIISGLERVEIIENEKMYYDEFALPSGRLLRVPSDKIKYFELGLKNAKPRGKTMTNSEIADAIKGDSEWL